MSAPYEPNDRKGDLDIPMRLQDMCVFLGWIRSDAGPVERDAAKRRLIREIQAVERQQGARILIDVSGADSSRRSIRITKRAVRRFLPHYFLKRPDDMAREVRRAMSSLDERITEAVRVAEVEQERQLMEGLDILAIGQGEIYRQLQDLDRRLERMEKDAIRLRNALQKKVMDRRVPKRDARS